MRVFDKSTPTEPKMITYEWDCETVDRESQDILDHNYGDSLDEVRQYVDNDDTQHRYDIVLVRSDVNHRYIDCAYAYMREDGTLPEYFTDAGSTPAAVKPFNE
jgi:hypothetical protein